MPRSIESDPPDSLLGVGAGEAVDLSQSLYKGMSTTPVHGTPDFTFEEYATCAATDISLTHIEMSAHMGTHIDAARHFYPGASAIDDYDVALFEGAGIVVDVERQGIIGVDAGELEGLDIRPDDFVLFHFGYGRLFGHPDYLRHPYLTADAADFLVEMGVRMVGVDTVTPDLPAVARFPEFDFPVHRRLLSEDILIIENLGPKLAELRGCRVVVSAAPLAIRGGDAGPARVFARRVLS